MHQSMNDLLDINAFNRGSFQFLLFASNAFFDLNSSVVSSLINLLHLLTTFYTYKIAYY